MSNRIVPNKADSKIGLGVQIGIQVVMSLAQLPLSG